MPRYRVYPASPGHSQIHLLPNSGQQSPETAWPATPSATLDMDPELALRAKPGSTIPMEEIQPENPYFDQPPLPLPTPAPLPHRVLHFWWAVRYAIVCSVVFVGLLLPMILFQREADPEEAGGEESLAKMQAGNLIFYLCLWLEVTWVAAVLSDIFGLTLPYLFRLVARYINSAHRRYWRVLKLFRRPICFSITTTVSFLAFTLFINFNPLLAVNANKNANSEYPSWDEIINDILSQLILWVALYVLEKLMISYLAVHYHYRRSDAVLQGSKDVHKALVVLYEASLYLHPEHGSAFAAEDSIIRNAKGDMQASTRRRLSTYLARLGIDGYKLVSLFGNFISAAPEAHWLRPGSSYSVIDRAWVNPAAAEAIAKRVWKSFVTVQSGQLRKEDIVEVLGSAREKEASTLFSVLNENDRKEIPLRDFIGIVVEKGRIRHNAYRTIADLDHCINTFDWICLLAIAGVMTFFIGVQYVPAIKQIQTVISSLAIGLSFAIGRTFHHLLTGIIFVFFDHPFDVADVVSICAPGSKGGIRCTVKRQSLFYTIFQRQDNNAYVQISNDQLVQKSIENYTRCGINRQSMVLLIDFRTSFKDINRLRTLLEDFIRQHSSDYVPGSLALNITSLHELNKMELQLAFTHRNNWSDNKLRSQRSNNFHCALVAACRQIPLYHPGGLLPQSGQNGNPTYTTTLNTAEVLENINKENHRRQGLRWDSSDDDAVKGEKPTCNASVLNAEDEAYIGFTGLSAGRPDAALSTGADFTRQEMGLRLGLNHRHQASGG